MKALSYNKEILIATSQMQMLFNNIMIVRNDGKNIIVPCVFGQRSRVLKFLQNPSLNTYQLPMTVLQRGNVKVDSSRSSEIHYNMLKKADFASIDPNTIPPVPIDIEYKLSIITKYPDDMDMITSNFIPFFHKDVYVTSPHPKIEQKKINHQVIWSGNFDDQWPSELEAVAYDHQICNTSFTFKTEIFGGTSFLKEPTGIIYNIDLTLDDYTSADGTKKNIMGGFYQVPYATSFVDYVTTIQSMSVSSTPEEDLRTLYDEYSYNAFDGEFMRGVLNGDIDTVSGAVLSAQTVSSSVNVYNHSYWPTRYSEDRYNATGLTKYRDISGYLINDLSGLYRPACC